MSNKWSRKPKTTQERRHTSVRGEFLDVEGYQIKIRACRNGRNLINAWDEMWMPYQRTWKKHRRTQYKPL